MTKVATESDDARFAFRPTATKALRLFFERCIDALDTDQIKDAVDVGMACHLLRDLVCAHSQYDEDAEDGFDEGLAGDYQPDKDFLESLRVPSTKRRRSKTSTKTAGKFHIIIRNDRRSDTFYVTDKSEPVSLREALALIELINKHVHYTLLPA